MELVRTKRFFYFLLICCVGFLFVACAGEKVSNEFKQDYTSITNLHKELNEKHGKTASYFANIAIANEDYDKAYKLLHNECLVGSVLACLNAYYIGEERALSEYDSVQFARELQESIKKSASACNGGESLGCVNVFFAFDALNDNDAFITNSTSGILNSLNNDSVMDKALNLTKRECASDDATSCFYYARMLRSMDTYADVENYVNKALDLGFVLAPFVHLPTQSPLTIDYFKRACALDEALSCRYAAFWFDKYEGDSRSAKQYYAKSCKLGIESSCTETHKTQGSLDETGSPNINRR